MKWIYILNIILGSLITFIELKEIIRAFRAQQKPIALDGLLFTLGLFYVIAGIYGIVFR